MMRTHHILIPFFIAAISGCAKKAEVPETTKVRVPVTITHPVVGSISESITLTATSSYQRKNIVSSSVQGYILRTDVALGDHVTKGQPLFTMQTKESHVVASSSLPDSLKIFGKITIPASASGIVTAITRQTGDYVQDGEQLCTIADVGSFAFVLNVPYNYIRSIKIGESCELLLPDSTRIPARIGKKLATVEAASQTQNYLIIPSSGITVPENIIAQVRLHAKESIRATLLPKQAVLADETMQNFWVMQLTNDTLAVKVPVQKGIESGGEVEIFSPRFSPEDRIVLTGNYGMEDSAFVTIRQ
jgi:biotin carboxyl carrier protein